jgi:hypothetical protein
MWSCSDYERQLRPTEKRLFVESVCRIADSIEADVYGSQHDDYSVFGKMSKGEKLISLAYVCSYLTNDIESPSVHAWMQSTISSVFDCVNDYVYEEIETLSGSKNPKEFKWRLLVISAFSGVSNTDKISKNFNNDDYEVWHDMIEEVKGDIIDDIFKIYESFCRITGTYVGPTSNDEIVRLARAFLKSIK